jgi:hypothetical protein
MSLQALKYPDIDRLLGEAAAGHFPLIVLFPGKGT